MPIDYKHRATGARSRPSRSRKGPAGWIALAFVLAGVAGASGWMAYRQLHNPDPKPEEQAAVETQPARIPAALDHKARKDDKTPPQTEQTQKPETPEPRFTFYKILPEKEVIIPESEIKNLKREESLTGKPVTQYQIQAGSFPHLEDAHKLKSRLSQVGIKSRLENVKIENLSWYRVKIGPFKTVADADKVRAHLRANQIDSVVQKALGQ
jgi:cell division protein FtsN